MTVRAGRASRRALAACVAAWPFAGAGIASTTTAVAFLPLLLPLPGLARGAPRSLRAAPMALAPALALAVTETLVNPPARAIGALSLALVLLAFAAVLASIRSLQRD